MKELDQSCRRRRDPGNRFSGKVCRVKRDRPARIASTERIAVAFQHDLGAVGQSAHDVAVEQHAPRSVVGPGGCGFRRQRFRPALRGRGRWLSAEQPSALRRALAACVAEDRDGAGVRRSTTRCTCPSDFEELRAVHGNSCIAIPARSEDGRKPGGPRRAGRFETAEGPIKAGFLIRPVEEPKVARMARQAQEMRGPVPSRFSRQLIR